MWLSLFDCADLLSQGHDLFGRIIAIEIRIEGRQARQPIVQRNIYFSRSQFYAGLQNGLVHGNGAQATGKSEKLCHRKALQWEINLNHEHSRDACDSTNIMKQAEP